jgi:hypothetical protein
MQAHMRVVVQNYTFFNLCALRGWVVNAMYRKLFPEKNPVSHFTEGRLDPAVGFDGCKNLHVHRGSNTKPSTSIASRNTIRLSRPPVESGR